MFYRIERMSYYCSVAYCIWVNCPQDAVFILERTFEYWFINNNLDRYRTYNHKLERSQLPGYDIDFIWTKD